MPLQHALLLSAILFALGLAGALVRRSLLIVLMSLQVMTAGVVLALVAYAAERQALADIEAFATLVIATSVIELPVGLALVFAWFRRRHSTDARLASLLRW